MARPQILATFRHIQIVAMGNRLPRKPKKFHHQTQHSNEGTRPIETSAKDLQDVENRRNGQQSKWKKGNDLIHFRSEKKRHAVLAVTSVDLTRWWSIIDQAKPIADDSLGHGGGGAEGNSKFIGALVLSTCSQLVRFLRKQMAHCCDLAPDA